MGRLLRAFFKPTTARACAGIFERGAVVRVYDPLVMETHRPPPTWDTGDAGMDGGGGGGGGDGAPVPRVALPGSGEEEEVLAGLAPAQVTFMEEEGLVNACASLTSFCAIFFCGMGCVRQLAHLPRLVCTQLCEGGSR